MLIVECMPVLVERARRLADSGDRRILGIAGPPGAGKSTIAEEIAAQLGARACLVPMDGFHLEQAELVLLGSRDRMGAPDAFDAAGYVALLERLRARTEAVVRAPSFDRDVEEPVAGAIAIRRDVPLVITEGNHLRLDEGDWARVRPLLDEAWYVEADQETRLARLTNRYIETGKPPERALAWAVGPDQRNAELVARTPRRADILIRLHSNREP